MESRQKSANFSHASSAATDTPRFPYMTRWEPTYERKQMETLYHPLHTSLETKATHLSPNDSKHHRPHSCPSLPATGNVSRQIGVLQHPPIFDVGSHDRPMKVIDNMADYISSFGDALGKQKDTTDCFKTYDDSKPNLTSFHEDDIVEPQSRSFVDDGISPLLKLVKLVKGPEPFSWPRGSRGGNHHSNSPHAADGRYLLPDSTCPDDEGPGLQLAIDSLDLYGVARDRSSVKSCRPLTDFSGTESPLHSDGVSVESCSISGHLVKSPPETQVEPTEVKREPAIIVIDQVTSLAASAKSEPVDFVVDAEVVGDENLVQIKPTSSSVSLPSSEASHLSSADISVDTRNRDWKSGQQPSTGRFKCLFCVFATNHKLALELHSLVHTASPPFTCPRCQWGNLHTSDEYNQHILLHVTQKEYACSFDKCQCMSDRCSNPDCHYKHQHNVQPRPANINSVHLSSPKFRHRCRTCPFVTGDFNALNMHKVVHRQAPPYDCQRCGATQFLSAKEFSIHVLMHVDEAKFYCKLKNCLYASKHSSNVLRHYRLKHNRKHSMSLLSVGQVNADLPQQPSDPSQEIVPSTSKSLSTKRFRCKKCNFSSRCLKKWRVHWLKHAKRHRALRRRRLRPYGVCSVAPALTEKEQASHCELCDFTCESKEALKQHVDQIHRIKKCTQCSYSTVDWRQYQAHIEGHALGKLLSGNNSDDDDDGEYICPSCEFRCRELSEWKAHKCLEKKRETNIVSTLKRMVYDSNTYPSIETAHNTDGGNTDLSSPIMSDKAQAWFAKGFSPRQSLLSVSPIGGKGLLDANKLKEMQSPTLTVRCTLCSYYTTSEAGLQAHMARMHSHRLPFRCKACWFGSVDKSDLYRHIRGKHNIFDVATIKCMVEVSETCSKVNTGFYQDAISTLCSSLPNPSHQPPMDIRRSSPRSLAFDPLLKTGETKWRDGCDEKSTNTCSSNIQTPKTRLVQRKNLKFGNDKAGTSKLAVSSTPSYGEKLANIISSGLNDVNSDDSSSDTDVSMFTVKPHEPDVVEEDRIKGLLMSSTSRINDITVQLYRCKVCGNQSHIRQDVITHIKNRHTAASNSRPKQVSLAQLYQQRSGKTKGFSHQSPVADDTSSRQPMSYKRPFPDNSNELSSRMPSRQPHFMGQRPSQPWNVNGSLSAKKVENSASGVGYFSGMPPNWSRPSRLYPSEKPSQESKHLVHGTIDPATIEIVSDSEDSDH